MQDREAADDRGWLTPEEIRAWPAAAPPAPGVDPRQPLRLAMERNGLDGPLQLAGRHMPVGCVALEITQRCNLDCQLCYLSDYAEAVHDLPLAEVFRRIDLIAAHYGPRIHVQVTGGDPTLRRRGELVLIVRRLAARDLRPALFTNGIRASRELLRELAAAGLVDVAFHVDMTQGRKGYSSEAALNAVRLDYLERARGLGLHVLFNTTVTEASLPEVPALVRFFIEHVQDVHLASFQLQADTGRGVLRKAGPGLTRQSLIRQIEAGTGTRLAFDHPAIGHPHCNRYAGVWVAGGRAAPVFDDPAFFGRLLARSRGWDFGRRDRSLLRRRCVVFALRHPGLWPRGLRYLGRKLRELGPGLLGGRGRIRKLSLHIHAFMDADRLERARCESCVFMTMTGDGPVSMCVHNARRDAEILKPLRAGREGPFWDPLSGSWSTNPSQAGPPLELPLRRLKGRLRAQAVVRRRRAATGSPQEVGAASFSDQS